jgi:uncharacterized membrane protein YtjA (UPF0391 family)
MSAWPAIFLVAALVAGVLGVTGAAGSASEIAQALFFALLIPALVTADGFHRPRGQRRV